MDSQNMTAANNETQRDEDDTVSFFSDDLISIIKGYPMSPMMPIIEP